MSSFEVHYVVVAQKISPLEGAKYEKNHHISAPHIHKDLQQNKCISKDQIFNDDL